MQNFTIPVMLLKKRKKKDRLFVFSMLFHSDPVKVLK